MTLKKGVSFSLIPSLSGELTNTKGGGIFGEPFFFSEGEERRKWKRKREREGRRTRRDRER